jgi:hypothetical protein
MKLLTKLYKQVIVGTMTLSIAVGGVMLSAKEEMVVPDTFVDPYLLDHSFGQEEIQQDLNRRLGL